jgi:hypothetical protein
MGLFVSVRRPVYKSTYTITVLSDRPLQGGLDGETILYEINEGDCLGTVEETVLNEEVPAEKVVDEEVALGNDGSFFGCMDCDADPCVCDE